MSGAQRRTAAERIKWAIQTEQQKKKPIINAKKVQK